MKELGVDNLLDENQHSNLCDIKEEDIGEEE